ncbi:MAG: hypothetical protein GY765_17115 [bacterium]|nr:hypothetical protein [bacterium]
MDDELKKLKTMVEQDEGALFENYLQPRRYNSKFWLGIIMAVILVGFALVYKFTVLDAVIPPEELKASLEIFNIDSQWVVKEEVHEKDFNGIILVPSITFQFRNVGKRELDHVYVLGVFRLLNRAKSLGEDYDITLKDGLKPGAVSAPINLISSFGYRASSKAAFARNSKDWRSSYSEIFIKRGSSQLSFLKKLFILRKIEGYDMDVELTIK